MRRTTLLVAIALALTGLAVLPGVGAPAPTALDTEGAPSRFADEPLTPDGSAGSDATTTTSAPPAVTTTTAPRSTTPSTARPKPNATGEPGAPNHTGDYGPEAPGTAHFKYEAGRTHWEHSYNGVAIAITMSTATIKTGDLVTFDTQLSKPGTPCCTDQLLFGDGSQFMAHNQASCPGGTYGPGTVHDHVSHAWNKSGYWTLMFGGAPGGCDYPCCDGATMKFTIYVAPGTTSSQGPEQPTITVDESGNGPPAGPGQFKLYAFARDNDGWIRHLVVDWGDGSPTETYPGQMTACTKDIGGWPTGSQSYLPSEPPPTHTYAPGPHTITVTVYSTGCDGADEQQASASLVH